VAIGLVMVAVVALLSLGILSMKGSSFSTSKVKAAKLSNEEMELVRAYRDSQVWSDFWNQLTSSVNCQVGIHNCFVDSDLVLSAAEDTSVSPFTRYFNVEDISGGSNDKLKITVTVSWEDQSGTHEVKIDSVLSDWQ